MDARTLKLSQHYLGIFQKLHSVCLQIVVQLYLSVSMQRELSLTFHRNNVYGHLEQVSRTYVYFHFQFTQFVLQT